MENKKVFHVTRSTKTGKSVDVGDFDTVEQAQKAMLKHYRETPKRGQFCYRITEEELKEIGGVVYRQFCLVIAGGNRPYNRRFDGKEMKELAS